MSRKVMRLYLFSCVTVFFSIELLAQQPVFRSQNASYGVFPANSSNSITKPSPLLPESGKRNVRKRFAPEGTNIHLMPLFGGFDKTENQKTVDGEFLKVCDVNFKNRKEASEFFSVRAWEYLSEGQRDTATYRFNLAYLLDDENIDVYWGLGVINYQNDKYEDAVELMEYGLQLDNDDNITLIVDLSTVYLKWYMVEKKTDYLDKTFSLLAEAIRKSPECANAYMQLSLARLTNNQLDDAWENFHKGYELDPQSANPDILQALLDKKEDPRGTFKRAN